MRGIFFFFNDTATTEIYTLSLHDALPIYRLSEVPARRPTGDGPSAIVTVWSQLQPPRADHRGSGGFSVASRCGSPQRSEEHTSELQSRQYLVCRLLLEKKKTPRARGPVRA